MCSAFVFDWSASLSYIATSNLSHSGAEDEISQHVIGGRETARLEYLQNLKQPLGFEARKFVRPGQPGGNMTAPYWEETMCPSEVAERRKKNGELCSGFRVDLRRVPCVVKRVPLVGAEL